MDKLAWKRWRPDWSLKAERGSVPERRRVVRRRRRSENARLWKRKKPNSPAGNFPPSHGSSAPPHPCDWPGSSPPRKGARSRGWGAALS